MGREWDVAGKEKSDVLSRDYDFMWAAFLLRQGGVGVRGGFDEAVHQTLRVWLPTRARFTGEELICHDSAISNDAL